MPAHITISAAIDPIAEAHGFGKPQDPAVAPVWLRSQHLVDYAAAVAVMEVRVAMIRAGAAPETVWLLEHPPVFTAGTSASDDELLDPGDIPVVRTGRGGRITYHGPGQRIAYVMLDLSRRGGDVRAFVRGLEDWIIDALARLGVTADRRDGRTGVWVADKDGRRDAKIAAIGVRIRRWVSYHGISINVAPDLSSYDGIIPCGIDDAAVTSLRDLGLSQSMADLDGVLADAFARHFPSPTLDFSPSPPSGTMNER